MSTDPLHLAVLVGSTRDGRRGRVVTDWFVGEVADRPEFEVEVIDLLDVDLPARFPMYGSTPTDGHVAFRARLDRADAFVVVTPEYNHSYPASVKHAIDLGKGEWARKPVAFVSYGGVSGGLRAVEHLRGVFAELHAATIRETVSFHGPWNGFGTEDHPADPPSARQAVTIVLDDLLWWGRTLRAGRRAALESSTW